MSTPLILIPIIRKVANKQKTKIIINQPVVGDQEEQRKYVNQGYSSLMGAQHHEHGPVAKDDIVTFWTFYLESSFYTSYSIFSNCSTISNMY